METLQLKAENESGYSHGTAIFDGSNVYERCHRCAEVHWTGWPCYHCTIVKRRISKRSFVSPLTPPRKYLSSTLARCKHCNLAIWERTRKQTFHPECKALWDERKRTVFKVNQILWSIRKKGYYVLDDKKRAIVGMNDQEILVAIGHGLPLDVIYENKNGGGFRFKRVEFRPREYGYPWTPTPVRSTLDKKRKQRAQELYEIAVMSTRIPRP